MVSFPKNSNSMLLRLENLQDVLDGKSDSVIVDLDKVVRAILKFSNQDASPEFTIKEKSLTANMDLDEMLTRRIKWKTVDDAITAPSKLSYVFDGSLVTLESQRIRVFEVTVTRQSEVTFLN